MEVEMLKDALTVHVGLRRIVSEDSIDEDLFFSD
jgi:hypothetical protein